MTSFSETVFDVASRNITYITESTSNRGDLTEDNTVDNHIADRNPLQIWIIQVGAIMVTTQLLSLPLKKVRQPRVIAEVLGGIMLSPSALGRIPGFTQAVFPAASKPYLALVANIGLVLFMFLVGLEIEGSVIRRNARLSASIALSGMVIPFALGSAFSVALYEEFIDPGIKFTHFLLFVGVAFSITAFPVLCRILTELKLLETTVGVVVLSAGVANDVVGWTLLAFSMALANATSGLTALWVLFACVGWAVFLLFPVRKFFHWLAHRTGSTENGPTAFFMTATMLMMFCSALVTDAIGIHAIFGSFLAGIIMPRRGGLAVALTEKLEDMVSIVFLPLYFTLSGLSTDFSLLDNTITWVYTLGIISIAWVGKFGGCTVAARISGFEWREAMSIGTLMSCKGLVELIVLNVGLSAGILNTRVYSMFVLEALLLTFFTTPVVVALYPIKYRKRAAITGSDYEGIIDDEDVPKDVNTPSFAVCGRISRITVVLDKLEHLPGIITMTQLFQPFVLEMSPPKTDSDHSGSSLEHGRTFPTGITTARSSSIRALRLIEHSEHASTALTSSIADSLIHIDPLLSLFKTFCDMIKVPVSPSLSVVPFDALTPEVIAHARKNLSDLILVSWLPFHVPTACSPNYLHTGGDPPAPNTGTGDARSTNPVDMLLKFGIVKEPAPELHAQFVRGILGQSGVNVALFVDRGVTEAADYGNQRVVLPFFGGRDDRLALAMVVQMCGNAKTTAKVIRVARQSCAVEEHEIPEPDHSPVKEGQGKGLAANVRHSGHSANLTTPRCSNTTQTQLQSNAADDTLWQWFTSPSSFQTSSTRMALERVDFVQLESPTPLREVLARVQTETDTAVQEKLRPFIVMGRAQLETRCAELEGLLDLKGSGSIPPGLRESLGDVATAFVVSSITAGLIVVQSAEK